MKDFRELARDEQIKEVSSVVDEICSGYFTDDVSFELISFEFNATFKVQCRSETYALRININSSRTRENVIAEIAFIHHLREQSQVQVPRPIPSREGGFVVEAILPSSTKPVLAVLFSWLDGSEVGEEAEPQQLFAIGVAMAGMHQAADVFELPGDSALPVLNDLFWGTTDLLFSTQSRLNDEDRRVLDQARIQIEEVISYFYARDSKIVIHADMHGWNLMWNMDDIAVFDFDDCGIGLPIQDLATALYCLDTPTERDIVLEGYRSIRALPEYSDFQMQALLLQRRILLLNYLYETANEEHRELIPTYLPETIRRAELFLNRGL
jgi:Ser/Thr protein kinase RdoA (MazF antagonist)